MRRGTASVMVRVRAKASDGEVRFFGDDASRMEGLLDDAGIGLRIHLAPTARVEVGQGRGADLYHRRRIGLDRGRPHRAVQG